MIATKPMTAYSELSDTKLIFACREGDQLAWEALITRYERLVYTVPSRYGLTQTEINDVYQSVWLALLKNLDKLRQPDRVSAWLVTTARRECWERRRGVDYKRTVSAESDQLLIDKGKEVPGPEEEVATFERHENLRTAMEELDDRCQKLLYHLYYDSTQPSYADVAQILEIPIGSIGPLRVRCLKKLRKFFESSS